MACLPSIVVDLLDSVCCRPLRDASFAAVAALANGKGGMPALQSFGTAVSFVTNTNWQSYSGEVLGFFVQMADSRCRTSGRPQWEWPFSLP